MKIRGLYVWLGMVPGPEYWQCGWCGATNSGLSQQCWKCGASKG